MRRWNFSTRRSASAEVFLTVSGVKADVVHHSVRAGGEPLYFVIDSRRSPGDGNGVLETKVSVDFKCTFSTVFPLRRFSSSPRHFLSHPRVDEQPLLFPLICIIIPYPSHGYLPLCLAHFLPVGTILFLRIREKPACDDPLKLLCTFSLFFLLFFFSFCFYLRQLLRRCVYSMNFHPSLNSNNRYATN